MTTPQVYPGPVATQVDSITGDPTPQKSTGGAAHVTSPALTLLQDSTTTSGYTYYGQAVPGTATSAAGWQIFRKDSSGNIYYASTGDFDQVWDNRASLTYA